MCVRACSSRTSSQVKSSFRTHEDVPLGQTHTHNPRRGVGEYAGGADTQTLHRVLVLSFVIKRFTIQLIQVNLLIFYLDLHILYKDLQ